MKHSLFLIGLIAIVGPSQAAVRKAPDPFCAPLQAFARSVRSDEHHEFTFHTLWGGNFNDSPDPAVFAKRCDHNGYAPAKAVCDYLMENGAVEFSGNNAKHALACLSPGTRFAPLVSLDLGAFSLSYGTPERGSNLTVEFSEDKKLGGMMLRVAADGY